MKKIYMILAAITLLSMSLNAQLLPANQLGGFDRTPTGKAHLKAPNGQFRMPTLNSDEYLVGPYITDDFDQTGLGVGAYYSSAQAPLYMVELTRDEFASHIGDTIIGFRFALAEETAVYNFYSWTASASYFDQANLNTWALSDFVTGNTGTETNTVTNTNDVSITGEYSSSVVRSKTVDNVTINTTTGDLGYTNYVRLNGTVTVSTSVGTITKIVFNGSNTTYPVTRLSTTTGSYTTGSNVGTWTGNASSVSFTASDYVYCSTVVVTVETSTTTTVNTVEIGKGKTQDEELPAYGYWHDRGYKNQMIYRAEQLGMASGAVISSLTFYPEEGTGIPFAGSTVTVRLGNTSTYNFGTGTTGNMVTSGLTTVATFTPVEDHNATEWTINFDTPFTYTGENLVVQVSCPGYMNDNTNGQFGHCYFYGDNQVTNVSIKVSGTSAQTATSGPTSKFLPKAKFAFTGSTESYGYMYLEGGQWYDFFLDEPVVFAAGDTIETLMIGYDYYQSSGTSSTPVAYNSNSTGHQHRVWMYTDSYGNGWFNFGTSGPSNTLMPGDLAVQLIFKQSMPKTPSPTITVSSDDSYYYITATADPSTPDAMVTLTVGGQTASAVGSVTIPVGRIYGQTQTVEASATAQETGMLPSDPTNETITVNPSPLEPTPAPTIGSDVLDATVQVTGNGQGTVHLYIDGQEVTNPAYLERTDQDYYVTVTVTAQLPDHSMTTTTDQVLVPALADLDLTGWTQLPGTYANNKVINWNDNLMFVDRFFASTAENNQPLSYTYVMKEDNIKLKGTPRTTNDHTIPVQWTNSKVYGYYTEQQVKDDTLRQVVETVLMNADVEMHLEKKSDIYYYTLDRSRNSILDANFLELSELQYDGNRYVEHDDFYTLHEPFYFDEGANVINLTRFDTINTVLPAATAPQGDAGKHFGTYDAGDYMAYVPIVWTWGNVPANKRAYWDRDSVHNSYGSPIWKTGAGKVELIGKPKLERQEGKNGSTNWNETVQTDTGAVTIPCSMYMVTDLTAHGYLPNPQVSNIKYEPYMFRVWVESKKDLLRSFSWVEGEGGDDPYNDRPGSHYVSTGIIPANTPFLIWEEEITDQASDNISDGEAANVTVFHKLKVTETETVNGDVHWAAPEEVNMMFAAPDSLKAKDIKIYVRFYYRSTGEALHQNDQNGMYLMATRGGGDNGFYGAEGDGDPDDEIPTFIKGVYVNNTGHGEVVSVTYYNTQGMSSSRPFDGMNIVVTRYSDGTATTSKVMKVSR